MREEAQQVVNDIGDQKRSFARTLTSLTMKV